MNTIHLMGAEEVSRAGHTMSSAGDTMRSAAGSMESTACAVRDAAAAIDASIARFVLAVSCLADIEGMKAANQHRLSLGHSIAYDEGAFYAVMRKLEQ